MHSKKKSSSSTKAKVDDDFDAILADFETKAALNQESQSVIDKSSLPEALRVPVHEQFPTGMPKCQEVPYTTEALIHRST